MEIYKAFAVLLLMIALFAFSMLNQSALELLSIFIVYSSNILNWKKFLVDVEI